MYRERVSRYTSPMLRTILGVIAGLFVGSIFNMALIMLNAYVLFPLPAGADMNVPKVMTAWIATLPTSAFLIVIVAHLGQAGLGGWLAARISSSRPIIPAMVVGTLTMLACIMNGISLPGPVWMWIEVPLCLVVAFGVGRIEERRRAGA